MGLFGGKNEKEVKMSIEGMHCDMCAANLQRELKLVDGVKKADVSFAEKRATVVYDEKKADIDRLKEAVSAAGYQMVEVQE